MRRWIRRHFSRLICFWATCTVLLFYYEYYWNIQTTIKKQYEVSSKVYRGSHIDSKKTKSRGIEHRKLFMIYTGLFGQKPWNVIPYDYDFHELDGSKCAESRCSVSYESSDLKVADAVLAYGVDLLKLNLNVLKRDRSVGDTSKQIWIYFSHEPPALYSGHKFGRMFNWTASYRTDSDVFVPYFDIQKLEQRRYETYDMAARKDKLVFAVISNCWKPRLDFIRQLMRHGVKIDVYGKCSYTLGRYRTCGRKGPTCFNRAKEYKFYLAFENSFCDGYVTEKYYDNGLLKGLVPIVAGAANYSDSRVAIPGSFIDVRNFKDVKELAEYLDFLDKNATAYNAMFEWQNFYRVKQVHYMCKMCKALWEKQGEPSKQVDLSKYWNPKTSCSKYDNEKWESAFGKLR